MKKIRVYYSHAMTGLDQGDRRKMMDRIREFKKLLGSDFDVVVPESWQKEVTLDTIYHRDVLELRKCSLVFMDSKFLWNVAGRGVYEEVGFAKAAGIPVIELLCSTDRHPFSYGSEAVFVSLLDAANYIKERYNETY